MIFTNKKIFLLLFLTASFRGLVFGSSDTLFNQPEELVIIGGGMVGAIEALYAHRYAEKNNLPISITIYEKNDSISQTTVSNIVTSLTCDEILSVVPRGPELVKKLEVPFYKPGGIRVDDVTGIDGTPTTEQFKQAVQIYSYDEQGHIQRTHDLLVLGKMSMDMWQEMYHNADAELRKILDSSNFNPCREPLYNDARVLHDGYRID